MRAFNYRAYNLELDACPHEHGFWLDAGEAERVRAVLRERVQGLQRSAQAEEAWAQAKRSKNARTLKRSCEPCPVDLRHSPRYYPLSPCDGRRIAELSYEISNAGARISTLTRITSICWHMNTDLSLLNYIAPRIETAEPASVSRLGTDVGSNGLRSHRRYP
jgi:Zn-finger nucleic acid-binding protein